MNAETALNSLFEGKTLTANNSKFTMMKGTGIIVEKQKSGRGYRTVNQFSMRRFLSTFANVEFQTVL